jgi:hypothetical protein
MGHHTHLPWSWRWYMILYPSLVLIIVTNVTAVHCLVMYHHVHRRHEHCVHVISTTTATTLGLSNNDKFQHRHHNHSHRTSTRIPQPKASVTITNDDDANNIIQLKLLDAQNVEMQLSNAVYKLNRIRQRQQIIPLEQKIEFPSVRQCNAGKCVQCIVCVLHSISLYHISFSVQIVS